MNVAGKGLTAGAIAQAMAGPAMAIAIGYALKAPAMVLFTLPPVGYAANALEAQEVRSRCTSSRFSPARSEKR